MVICDFQEKKKKFHCIDNVDFLAKDKEFFSLKKEFCFKLSEESLEGLHKNRKGYTSTLVNSEQILYCKIKNIFRHIYIYRFQKKKIGSEGSAVFFFYIDKTYFSSEFIFKCKIVITIIARFVFS